MKTIQIIVAGRAFEQRVGSCTGCAFNTHGNHPMSNDDKLTGCLLDSNRSQSCMSTRTQWFEVGRDFK